MYSDRAARLFGVREIMDDKWMLTVEGLRRGVAAIAVLGDGQADDANRWIVDRIKRCPRGLASEDHLADRSDYGRGLVSVLPLDERVERVLRCQRVAHSEVCWKQSDANDTPLHGVATTFHQIVRVARHVRAMEAAKTEVDDPATDFRGIEARSRDSRRKSRQGGAREIHQARAAVRMIMVANSSQSGAGISWPRPG